jgi:hypothetical protein
MKKFKKNELEMLLLCCEKAINRILDENPKAGIIVDKGEPTEVKMRYKDALVALQKLDVYFGLKGSTSFGLCMTCTKWDRTAHHSVADCCGDCRGGLTRKKDFHPNVFHAYDSCDYHSKEGGGYGL